LAEPEQGGEAVVPAGIFLLASAFLDLLAGQGIQGEADRNLRHGEFSSAAASFAQSAAILRKNPQGGSITAHPVCLRGAAAGTAGVGLRV
jgi:hypothetical protein